MRATTKTTTIKPATEAEEQKALFRWAEMMSGRYPELHLLHHIPNGGTRNPREARNLKLEGVKPGVPDIFLPVPRGGNHGLYIELKRVKGGKVSDDQRGWIEALNRQGYLAVVCKGWLEAQGIIMNYLRAEGNNHDDGIQHTAHRQSPDSGDCQAGDGKKDGRVLPRTRRRDGSERR